jgi:hypothetical protein
MAAPSINLLALFIPLVHIRLRPIKLIRVPGTVYIMAQLKRSKELFCVSFFALHILKTIVSTILFQ